MKFYTRKIYIKGKNLEKSNCSEIYEQIGLKTKYFKNRMAVKSTKIALITKTNDAIYVNVSAEHVSIFLKEKLENGKGRKAIVCDNLGNKIYVNIVDNTTEKTIGILTSGGDAPGMNPAIRAIIRSAIKKNGKVYGIYCGYDGLINDKFEELHWNSFDRILSDGGTALFSARSRTFMTKEGRKMACLNLAKRKIDNLIVMGGDGTIIGANILSTEYEEHIKNLVAQKLLENDVSTNLNIIVLPASIDNDIPYCNYTLGADTALHRVVESVDNIISTMMSHLRIFVIEVMGRHCGWIALMSSLATGADFMFLPETPKNNWKDEILFSINKAREKGKKGMFLIISEGAVDQYGVLINSQDVVDHLSKNIENEVRLLKLGHLQRGGPPSALDRITGTLLGLKAVKRIFSKKIADRVCLCIYDGKYTFEHLEKIILKSQEIEKLRVDKKFSEILDLRGETFKRIIEIYEKKDRKNTKMETIKKIGILHCGRNVGGMNTSLNALIRYCSYFNEEIYVIEDGFYGLMAGKIRKPNEYDYVSYIGRGGSLIGTVFSNKFSVDEIYKKIKEYGFEALIIMGGSDMLFMVETLKKKIQSNDDNVDIILIPATTSNNIPCTDICIGSDTALNVITKTGDSLLLTSMSVKNTVFLLEVQGGYCGYLSLLGGIATGAFASFIPEQKNLINHLSKTAKRLANCFSLGQGDGILMIRNEKTFNFLDTDALAKIIKADSEYELETKCCMLGYMQQGANASPSDRIFASLLSIKAVDMVLRRHSDEKNCKSKSLIGIVGISGQTTIFTDIDLVLENFDREKKRNKKPAWLKYVKVCKSLH